MPKNILIVSGVFIPEPVVSANLQTQLATELSKNYNVTVLRPRPSRPNGFKMPDYDYSQLPFNVIVIDSYTCSKSSLYGRYKETRSMGRVCASYVDIHHDEIDFIYNDAWWLWGINMVAKAAVKNGIPYISPVQDIYPESLMSKLPNIKLLRSIVMKMLAPIDLYTLTHAAKVHTISDKMMRQLSETRGIPEDRFVVVKNWQNEDEFIKYRDNHPDKEKNDIFTFMYLGNIGPLAGIHTLFKALYKSGLKDARLIVAGSGSARNVLMEKAKEYTDCNIEFWNVPSGQVPAIQSKADVMCLPVKKGYAMTSIPSKLPAYMFSAKPVLASVDKESDTAACITNADAGWVAAPEDVDDIAQCMKEAYYTSSQELIEIGKRGFDFSIQHLSKKMNLPMLVNACVEVIENQTRK